MPDLSPELAASLLRVSCGEADHSELDRQNWLEWFNEAIGQRCIPLLAELARSVPDAIDDDQLAATDAAHLDAMGVAVRIEHELLAVSDTLDSIECPAIVLKGCATAHLDHARPELRQVGDVDILVKPADFTRAIAALTGDSRTQAYPLPRHHERFTHAVTLRHENRVEVDLHRRIGHRSIGARVPVEELFERAIPLDIAGRSLLALDVHDRLIHAALHSASSRGGYRRLNGVADVLVIASAEAVVPDLVMTRARKWGLQALVAIAIHDAFECARLDVPNRWDGQLAAARAARMSLAERAYSSETRRPVLEELAYLQAMPTWNDRATYLRGYLATDRAYSRHTGRSGTVAQARYLWSRLRER